MAVSCGKHPLKSGRVQRIAVNFATFTHDQLSKTIALQTSAKVGRAPQMGK